MTKDERKALLKHRRLLIEEIIRHADKQRELLSDLDKTEAKLGMSRWYDSGSSEIEKRGQE